MKRALYQEALDNQMVKCVLCPHACVIPSGARGKCGSRINHEGVLMAMTYGKMLALANDPIEKKPLNHFHPGSMILSIGTTGCNLTCDFCQNHELVYADYGYHMYTPEAIVSKALAFKSIGIAYTYNEPTVGYEFVLDTMMLAHEAGLKNVWVTNGYINQEPLLQAMPLIDAMNIDLKSMDEEFYVKICGGTINPVLETIRLAQAFTHVEATHLITGETPFHERDVQEVAGWLGALNNEIPLHLSRYFPAYKMKTPSPSKEMMAEALKIAKRYLKYVYLGNMF